jgi:hypothetical protein
LNIKWAFWFSLLLLSKTFLILRIIQRDKIKNIYIGLHVKCPSLSCPNLLKLEFSPQIFEKYSNIKFHKNSIKILLVGAELCGRMDGQTRWG